MKDIVIIYWSGTGNTEVMAVALAEGAKAKAENVKLLKVSEATIKDIEEAESVAIGCPSMGAEELEDSEMEPFITSIESAIKGKKLALFGSYGWGSGEWMTTWQARMEGCGAKLVGEGLIINYTPDELGLESCKSLGELLAT